MFKKRLKIKEIRHNFIPFFTILHQLSVRQKEEESADRRGVKYRSTNLGNA